MSKSFYKEGLELYGKHKGQKNITKKMLSFAREYKTLQGGVMKPSTLVSAMSKLKRAIIASFHQGEGKEVPTSVTKMTFPKAMYTDVITATKGRLMERAKQKIVIENGDELVNTVLQGLFAHSVEELYPALLLCTGRRSCELVTCKLRKSKGQRLRAWFTGQAKTNSSKNYEIPLLADVYIVQAALSRLQALLKVKQPCAKSLGIFDFITSRTPKNILQRHVQAHGEQGQLGLPHGHRPGALHTRH
jgi:hypothetical protein